MKRLTWAVMGLLVVGSTAVGCAHMPRWAGGGWVTLLDGADGMENWDRVGGANWRVVDGVIQADGGPAAGYLVSKNAYRDFEILVEFWASDDANSGIYMRCANPKAITDRTCYEANIFDQRPDPSYGTGAIVHIAKISPMPKAGGKWNTYAITAKGARLTLMLNGVRTVDVEDSKFAGGPIALQWARGVIKFRKVQIRPL
jgi:hypothetical protein